ncbi:hypothetical protein CERZMDRAFT_48558 [Cercospora zeae-maydis SCOH1-5]|uniref:Rab proteins geranylgeranyltransferase n=1 Tax=Cercospora zeae-maydis SCOH1-5 TaxID=717836 RepID=A0A6A6F6M6_9PEZI|nr:hypothetical protein CERZMDRAFT_48558 [Cercospora zeae-maydis SCOH1-5]
MQTDSLANSEWDVVIEGTGLPQSLLALALSRSGKKILHIDRNQYYGGKEASFGLTDAEEWAAKHGSDTLVNSSFSHATLNRPQETGETQLARPRAYELSLSPQLLYSRSSLLDIVVSSQIHNQLDFQAIGSWFVIDPTTNTLAAVPGSREDIFRDDKIDMRAKRSLMKLLRSLSTEDPTRELGIDSGLAFTNHLQQKYALPPALFPPILALTMSTYPPQDTTVEYATPRVVRHLRSVGVHAPSCPALLQRYGGLAEIIQVACRANAVGGGVYVLGTGASNIQPAHENKLDIELDNGDHVSTSWHIGEGTPISNAASDHGRQRVMSKSITIVGSPLSALFRPLAAGAVIPAGAIVMIPGDSDEDPPVYVVAHSSDSGECPSGQSILYASVASESQPGFACLERAIGILLKSLLVDEEGTTLWSLKYQQAYASHPGDMQQIGRTIQLPQLSPDLVLEDNVMESVKAAWTQIVGEEHLDSFMRFEAREDMMHDDGEGEERPMTPVAFE